MKTIKQLAQLAIDVQDACNAGGVAGSLSRDVMPALSDLGTDARNTHPIVRLFVLKLCHLSGLEQDFDGFSAAYKACLALAADEPEKEKSPDPYADDNYWLPQEEESPKPFNPFVFVHVGDKK